MARQNVQVCSFNGGEVSKLALGRVDVEKLRVAAACQLNWLPWSIGPMMLRPGLLYIGEVLSDQAARLVRFIFSKLDTALIELTPLVMRVWVGEALVSRVAVATTISDPTFAGGGTWSTANTTAGASATITGGVATLTCTPVSGLAQIQQTLSVSAPDQTKRHGVTIVVSNGPVTFRIGSAAGLSDIFVNSVLDTGTHCLAFTPGSGNASPVIQIESTDAWNKTLTSVNITAAGTLQVTTPWSAADLPTLRYDQSGDIVYLARYGGTQYKIERRQDQPGNAQDSWSVVLYRSSNGPFQAGPGSPAVLTPSVMYGNGTLTSSLPYFKSAHVGALFSLFTNGQTNQAVLGGNNAFSPAVRVGGVGTLARNYSWTISGTWAGTLAFQRSYNGPTSGFGDVSSVTVNGTIASATGGSGGTPDLDNVIAWERVGFENAGWTSGSATVNTSGFGAGGGTNTTNIAGLSYIGNFPSNANCFNATGSTRTAVNGYAGVLLPTGLPVNSVSGTITLAVGSTQNVYLYAKNTLPANGTDGTQLGTAAVSSTSFTITSNDLVTTYKYVWVYETDNHADPINLSSVVIYLGATTTPFGGGGDTGIARVTGFNSPTSVNIEVVQAFSSLNGTQNWLEQDWSGVVGYPTSVAFDGGRLWWFGRDEFWGSQSDNYTGFANADQFGAPLGDSGAINERFGAGPVDSINWALSLNRLLVGREGLISEVFSGQLEDVLTPTNATAKDRSSHGAARLPANKVGDRGLYVEQSGRRVYQLAPRQSGSVYGSASYGTDDLTRLNHDIGKAGFADLDVQRQPDEMHYLVRTDGIAAALLHLPEEQISCWWRLQTQGVIENVCVLPATSGIEDLVYFVVRRSINGATRRFIEKLALRDDCVGGLLNKQADCALVYSGVAVSTVTASWLPLTKCVVWADGQSIGTATSDGSGVFTMPDGLTHTNIVVGLGGQIIQGTTAQHLHDGSAPDQVFANPSNTLTVAAAFNGCPCEVFADSPAQTGKMVRIGTLVASGGVITLPNGNKATKITACCGYVAPFESAKLAYAAQMGSALAQKKRLDHIGLVLYDAAYQSLKFGQSFDVMDNLPLIDGEQQTAASVVWSEYDEPTIPLPGSWNTDARLCLLAQAPNPCTVGAVVLGIGTNEKS